METEFEAKFFPAPKDIRERLKEAGAKLITPERLMRRVIFDRRKNSQVKVNYIRIRDEGNKITLSAKVHADEGGKVSDQKEAVVEISDFDVAKDILESSGLVSNAYQENKRETWELNGAEVTIDTWPGLETYSEVEASSEEHVKQVADILGLNWVTKRITAVAEIYAEVYGLTIDDTLKKLEYITFEQNPFETLEEKS